MADLAIRDVDINQNKTRFLTNWFSINELLGVGGLPTSQAGMKLRATTENWLKRHNVKGITEYHSSSLPQLAQTTLQRLRLEDNCCAMPNLWKMNDDTMHPTFSKNEQLALNYQSTFNGEGIYLIKQGKAVNVRRIKRCEQTQQYVLICDNNLYQQERCSTLEIIAQITQFLRPI